MIEENKYREINNSLYERVVDLIEILREYYPCLEGSIGNVCFFSNSALAINKKNKTIWIRGELEGLPQSLLSLLKEPQKIE